MATENKSSLNNVLQAVLATVQQEQNFFYSPKVYTQHRNIIESLLLTELIKSYPANSEVIDQISPFVTITIIPVTDGYIKLPDGSDGKPKYRNILGSPMIFAKPDDTGECGSPITEPLTANNFKAGILKSGCKLNSVNIIPQSEASFRLRSTYDFPTHENPIGWFIDSNKIKLCPYDLTKVAVMYAKEERILNYGYYVNPDDTYGYDPATSIDTEFGSNAFDKIYNACLFLYSAYAKNPELQNWSLLLKERGIL